MNNHKLTIGIITYGELTSRYLPYFFESLEVQTYCDFNLIVVDNSEEKENKNKEIIDSKILNLQFPISFEQSQKNVGFAKGFNHVIEKARANHSKYVLLLNIDMIFEKDMIAKMVQALENDSSLGSVCPKILRWDFGKKEKTNIIDSCGIVLKPGLRFVDLLQGELDHGDQCNGMILGPSGAAAMYRISALEKVKDDYGYFDERMFMYKEDCDLAYRLSLQGYKSKCICDALCYHDRTASGTGESNMDMVKARKNKSKQVKIWSFQNQLLIYQKFWRKQTIKNKLNISYDLLKMIIYASILERYLLKELMSKEHYNKKEEKF